MHQTHIQHRTVVLCITKLGTQQSFAMKCTHPLGSSLNEIDRLKASEINRCPEITSAKNTEDEGKDGHIFSLLFKGQTLATFRYFFNF